MAGLENVQEILEVEAAQEQGGGRSTAQIILTVVAGVAVCIGGVYSIQYLSARVSEFLNSPVTNRLALGPLTIETTQSVRGLVQPALSGVLLGIQRSFTIVITKSHDVLTTAFVHFRGLQMNLPIMQEQLMDIGIEGGMAFFDELAARGLPVFEGNGDALATLTLEIPLFPAVVGHFNYPVLEPVLQAATREVVAQNVEPFARAAQPILTAFVGVVMTVLVRREDRDHEDQPDPPQPALGL